MTAAANLPRSPRRRPTLITGELDASARRPTSTRPTAWSSAAAGRASTPPPWPRLEEAQKTRAKRRHLDVVDRGLMDLVSVYRDAIALATGAPGAAGQRGDPRRRRAAWSQRLDARAQPAPDRLDLRGPRADAGVQRAGRLGAGVHDGGAAGARGERSVSPKQIVAIVLVALLALGVRCVGRAGRSPATTTATTRARSDAGDHADRPRPPSPSTPSVTEPPIAGARPSSTPRSSSGAPARAATSARR